MAIPLAIFLGEAAIGHEGATGIIAARMTVMAEMAKSMKAIGESLDGRREFNAGAALAAARALHQNCHIASEQFPTGTSDHHSRASPAVWENRDGFDAEMTRFDAAVKSLIVAAETGDAESMRAPFREVGRSCSSCHERFRLSER
ncbi:cytochrome c [Pseudaminobacter sp. 19-2017]|uniref:Cytochrome c n=2 Tax=Pseudaminobacter soli (ex Zhang et al. 2022) TaxID=2831468 RepID=A0A942E6T0_9HYPH|nr:cytochrome c [Pseudaminobacter soli]